MHTSRFQTVSALRNVHSEETPLHLATALGDGHEASPSKSHRPGFIKIIWFSWQVVETLARNPGTSLEVEGNDWRDLSFGLERKLAAPKSRHVARRAAMVPLQLAAMQGHGHGLSSCLRFYTSIFHCFPFEGEWSMKSEENDPSNRFSRKFAPSKSVRSWKPSDSFQAKPGRWRCFCVPKAQPGSPGQTWKTA